MQLKEEYGDKIECISVSLDYLGSDKEAVAEEVTAVLKKHQISVRNLIQANADTDVQKNLGAGIPIVIVYDAAGELKKVFHNGDQEYGADGFKYSSDVSPFVASLMKG